MKDKNTYMTGPVYTQLGLNEPWFIDSHFAQNYLPLLAQLLRGEKPVMEDASLARAKSKTYFFTPTNNWDEDDDLQDSNSHMDDAPAGSVAIMSLNGLIVKHSQFCGPKGTLDYAEDLKKIDRNPNFIGTVFKIESGGGQAYAVKYLTDVMATAKKPIVILAGNYLASAGYYIACYGKEIVADHPMSIVGSIGTMINIQNMQPALEKLGVEFHEIYATQSTLKNNTLSQAYKKNYQPIISRMLDPLNDEFVSEVQRLRPAISNQDVYKGETFLANESLELKMIDHLGDLEFAVQRVRELSKEDPVEKSKLNQSTNMNFENVAALAGVENATQAQIDQANADLTTAGITNVTLVPDSIISDAAAVTSERDTLTTQLAESVTARETAEASLVTVNAANTALQARLDVFEKGPGASHQGAGGKDEVIDVTADEEAEAILAAMPHNQNADSIFG